MPEPKNFEGGEKSPLTEKELRGYSFALLALQDSAQQIAGNAMLEGPGTNSNFPVPTRERLEMVKQANTELQRIQDKLGY